jgi:hypothetical protein
MGCQGRMMEETSGGYGHPFPTSKFERYGIRLLFLTGRFFLKYDCFSARRQMQ